MHSNCSNVNKIVKCGSDEYKKLKFKQKLLDYIEKLLYKRRIAHKMQNLKKLNDKLLGNLTFDQKNVFFEEHIEHLMKFMGERSWKSTYIINSLRSR